MRERHVCPKCQHNHILLISKVPDNDGEYSTKNLKIAVTFLGDGFFGEKLGMAGAVYACVCRRCGFTELYTRHPETIPIDGRYVEELVGPEPETPYR